MALGRSQMTLKGLSQSVMAVRYATTSSFSAASTAKRTFPSYTRKPISSTSAAAISKTAPVAAPPKATPTPSSSSIPNSDFDDAFSSSQSSPSHSSTSQSGSINALEGFNIPPPPLQSFPDSNYRSLPDIHSPPPSDPSGDWNTSFSGLSFQPFPTEVAKVLMRDLEPGEIEVKPDGILYMPEIRYRRRLNQAFGPGGWGMAPRGEAHITDKQVSREWGLVCLGRLVSVSRGESDYFDKTGINKAHESAKSNALMRCCKDLGIAAELWDPTFIKKYKAEHVIGVYAQNKAGVKKRLFRKKTDPKFEGAWKE